MDETSKIPSEDPALAALLRFEPVPRKQSRAGGWWSPENQRTFIRTLVETGDYRIAAEEVGLTANGAYQLRKEAGSDDFRRAWEEAVTLHRRRNGGSPRHPRELRDARARQAAAEPELEEAEVEAFLQDILKRYRIKLKAERRTRLEGRIVEADFYVRQLSFVELILDIGGCAQQVLESLKLGDRNVLDLVATPGSALLERARRAFWLEKGEADRPPPAPLGRHNDRYATGGDDYDPERDGDRKAWERRQKEKQRLAAEAQAEWEARAKADADRREGEPGTPRNDNDPAP